MSGVPNDLASLKAAVREWCQLDPNDPRATDTILERFINGALHRFQVANPNGWSWDKQYTVQTTDWSLGAGVAAFAVHNGGQMNVTAASGHFVRLRSLELIAPNGLWRIPLERITREEQLARFPRDSERGVPRTYSIMGLVNPFPDTSDLYNVVFRPVPDVTYTVRAYGCAPLSDLGSALGDSDPNGAGGAFDNQLPQYADAIVAYASFLVLRSRDELAESWLGAKAYFDEAVMALRKTNRIRVGAGFGNNPVQDEQDLL